MSLPNQAAAVDRYRARLDAHLATLPTDLARRQFCDREYERWQELYRRFEAEPGIMPAGTTASDFFITLSDISLRQIRYGHALVRAA